MSSDKDKAMRGLKAGYQCERRATQGRIDLGDAPPTEVPEEEETLWAPPHPPTQPPLPPRTTQTQTPLTPTPPPRSPPRHARDSAGARLPGGPHEDFEIQIYIW